MAAPSLLGSYAACREELVEADPVSPPPPPPPRAPAAPAPDVAVDAVVDYTVSAAASFEVFMGRVYDPAEAGLGLDALLLTQGAVSPAHASFDALAAHLTERLDPRRGGGGGTGRTALPPQLQSPLARYARLVVELQALQGELRGIGDGGGGAAASAAGSPLFRVLADGADVARERLEALRPAAEAAAARGGSRAAGVELSAAPAPPSAATLHALRAEVAALVAAQASVDAAAKATAAGLSALHARLRDLCADAPRG